MDKKLFSERLTLLRTQKKYTQVFLATKLEISQESISSFEKGKATPSLPKLIMLANIFECSLDYLVGLSDEPQILTKFESLDPHEQRLVENYSKANSSNRQILLVISELLARNNIYYELNNGQPIIKNFIPESK